MLWKLGKNSVQSGVEERILLWRRAVEEMAKTCGVTMGCTRLAAAVCDLFGRFWGHNVHWFYQSFSQAIHSFPHTLGIQFLPNFRYLLANHKIELDGFFNLFDRVNSGGVVFSA